LGAALLLARVGTIFLLLYAALLGAHYRGILIPEVRLLTLLMLVGLVIVWLIVRSRARWKWYRTPLDAALPLWVAAFALSLLFNLDASRRILTGLWYMGVYIGLWYLLQDLLANWKDARKTLVDGLLFIGVLLFALSAVEWQTAIRATGESLLEYRFRGLFGNPNLLGTFLAILILVAVGRLAALRSRVGRVILAAYVLIGALLLFLTDSRSAWLGTGAGLLAWVLLMRGGAVVMGFWRSRLLWKRASVIGAGLTLLLIGAVGVGWMLRSFTSDGRGLAQRPELFNAAVQMFLAKPLTGQGLFTFGRHLPHYISQPPQTVHSHAHNVVMQIAGELGNVGMAAGLATVVLMARAAWLAGRQMTGSARAEWSGAAAAIVGLLVIHLLDVTSMLPIIAIIGMIVLCIATTLPQPIPVTVPQAKLARNWGLVGIWVVLFAAGLWDTQSYTRYNRIVAGVYDAPEYAQVATALQPVADGDPAMPIYPAQQAFLWGLAAHEGDADAQQQAIAAYEHAVTLEPYYAPYYANLGALYWNAGDTERALSIMQRAAELAPGAWQMQYNLAVAAEALGREDIARAAYAQAFVADPDMDLLPGWGQTPLQAEISHPLDAHSVYARIVLLAEAGEIDAAIALWDAELAHINEVRELMPRILVALMAGDRETAQVLYERAQGATTSWETDLWLLLAQARLAQFDGDEAGATAALEQARELRSYDPFVYDYIAGPDMAYYQYFRLILPRQFLPQVFYPVDRILLLHLLADT
jgi:O-antigen ligase/tetratricopeptide (TPR) repeat protein